MAMAIPPLSLLLLLLLLSPLVGSEPPEQERAALLSFLSRTPHESRVNWSNASSACAWVGVTCDAAHSTVTELHLPGVGLVGAIPPGTLSRLPSLRVLSLRSNALSGPIPADLTDLHLLRSLYLQSNRLSGPIPAAVGSLTRLRRLDLSGNKLSGEIPFALSNLTRLTGLFLQNNSFTGKLPSIDLPALADFDVSNNRLNGSVPKALQRFPASAFSGNLDLCGGPLPPCTPPFFPSPAPSPGEQVVVGEGNRPSRKLSTAGIIAISVASGVVLFMLLVILIFCLVLRRRRSGAASGKEAKTPGGMAPRSVPVGTGADTGTSSSVGASGAMEAAGRNKLVFFENGMYSFDLEDLLRASAEVLGKGSMGTSYKAVLEDGTTVVVKRLKDVAVAKREFDAQMEALGMVAKHDNVVPLRAFYYSKDEKLLVYDYLPAGSLSALLHGSRGSGRAPLDWDNRLRIALAVGRGLAHLHHSARIPHGDLKASNVLLRPDPDNAAVSDFGLAQLIAAPSPPSSRAAGYRAPEVLETRRPTLKADVYSFGVLLLELLTGKAPNQASMGDEGIDLPRWVQSVVREEWTAEVFDVELLRHGQSVEEEMVQLLQIAMACVAQVPDARPDVRDVVRMMEEIARSRGEGDHHGVVFPSPPDDPNNAGPVPPAAASTP